MPDIERATLSARNDATLVTQAEIKPFAIGADGRTGVFNEMHFYDLPWPKAALEQLENEIVKMNVTLSYFIEPNPTDKAATRPDTYRSLGLRFEMRVSCPAFEAGFPPARRRTAHRPIARRLTGCSARKRSRPARCIAISGAGGRSNSPAKMRSRFVGGWWKSHAGQKRMADKARYALVISMSAPDLRIDLHAEITTLVEAKEIEVLRG